MTKDERLHLTNTLERMANKSQAEFMRLIIRRLEKKITKLTKDNNQLLVELGKHA